ncbi:Esterase EstD [Cyphellophora attinorum]|uniref:Esterase EstD n=1 Tax=Cyphellophora attinorum TaxID=1664694 RepID=A0A0N0NP62_9EURO|nr:Esterase EstD [Phialophora attinorum]KPI42391.1 Esterase EstD [Phialophora attinorum]
MAAQVATINTALEAFRDGDKTKFRSMFWTPYKLILTDHRASSVFDLSTFMLGPLKSWTTPEIHKDGYIKQYKTMAKFERTYQALTFGIWGNSLMGLGIGNAMDLGLIPPWKAPSYVDSSSFTEQDITIRPSYFQPAIAGTLTLPKTSSPDHKLPAILLVPGSGPIDRDETGGGGKCFKDLAHGLSSSNLITLRMDKPTTIILLKQLLTKTLTLEDEYIHPGLAALRYLASHPNVDPTRIFILGHSLGGLVAPRLCRAAAQANPRLPIAGLICCAPSTRSLAQIIARQMRHLNTHFPRADPAQHDKEMAQYEAVSRLFDTTGGVLGPGDADPTKDLAVPLPLSYLRDIWENDPIAIAKELDVPLLVVQGKADWQVTVADEYTAWREGLEGSKAKERMEWKLYDGVGHMLGEVDAVGKVGNFQYAEPWNVKEEVVRDIGGFVRQVSGIGVEGEQ